MARIGMITPSSNTVLEPVTYQMVADYEGELTAHFSRVRVTRIQVDDEAGQFSTEEFVSTASYLADARVDSIVWNGTSGAWLGLDWDDKVCATINETTGVLCTSPVLTLVRLAHEAGLTRIGMVTPYTDDVNARIVETLQKAGLSCAPIRSFGKTTNFEFAEISEEDVAHAARRCADEEDIQALVVLCTNMNFAAGARAFEEETGVPCLDSVSLALYGGMTAAGADTQQLQEKWGRLFQGPQALRPSIEQ